MRYALCAILCLASLLAGAACSKAGAPAAEAAYTGNAASDVVEAIRVGDADKLVAFIDADPTLLSRLDPQGRTLLHIAVAANQPEIVHLLIDRGMDPNVRDGAGTTPLGALELSGMRAEDAREAIIERGGISAS